MEQNGSRQVGGVTMKRTNDLTKGNVTKVMLSFFFPMLFTNLFQQLYTFVDTAIVGKGLGDQALGAVGNISAFMFLIIGFLQGITNGFSVVIAQAFGAKDIMALRKSVASSIKLAVLLALILTTISVISLKSALRIMQTDPVIFNDSLTYGYVIFGGMIVTMSYNLCAGILRAMGDSKTPFFAIMIASVVNILLDCLFIFGLKTGVEGAAVATILAQLVSVGICVMRLRKTEELQLTRVNFQNDYSLFAILLKNGVPMACMNSITAVGCIIVQSYVNALGVVYTCAYSACSKFVNLFMLPTVTGGFVVSAFTGQNDGAREYARIKDGVRVGVMIGLVSYILLGSILMLFPEYLVQILLTGNEPIELACSYLRVSGSMFWIINFMFVYRNAVQGMGKPLFPMISGVVEMVMRIFVIVMFLHKIGFKAAAYAEVSAWAGALLVNFVAYQIVIKKKLQKVIT